MAKQIVREYDNSSNVLPAYSNFTVVVPGFVANEKLDIFKKVADENGVYEVSSVADFIENIGKVSGVTCNAEAPELTSLKEATSQGEDIYHVNITKWELLNYLESGTLYSLGTKKKSATEVGYLEDTHYHYDKVKMDEETVNDIAFDANGLTIDKFSVIIPGNEGNDVVNSSHIGNQIAYMLLKQGYTVLYKQITNETQLDTEEFWEPLKDKSIYAYRYLMTGGYYSTAAMNRMIKIADFNNEVTLDQAETINDTNGRGDVIALCDVNESKIKDVLNQKDLIKKTYLATAKDTSQDAIIESKYAAIFAPNVYYELPAEDLKGYANNNKFPASFHYLACAAYSHPKYAEWYAVAGYNRGISNLKVIGTSIKYGNIAQNTLGPRTPYKIDNEVTITKSINLIITERDSYYIWGNRTAATIPAEGLKWSNYLNIRQACTTIKKQIIAGGKQYAFDPNSDILWLNFKSYVEDLLVKMKSDQGVEAFAINRATDRVRGAVKSTIRIVPIEAAEDFDIGLYLEDSLTVNAVESD